MSELDDANHCLGERKLSLGISFTADSLSQNQLVCESR
jgi:hypothetical protein